MDSSTVQSRPLSVCSAEIQFTFLIWTCLRWMYSIACEFKFKLYSLHFLWRIQLIQCKAETLTDKIFIWFILNIHIEWFLNDICHVMKANKRDMSVLLCNTIYSSTLLYINFDTNQDRIMGSQEEQCEVGWTTKIVHSNFLSLPFPVNGVNWTLFGRFFSY